MGNLGLRLRTEGSSVACSHLAGYRRHCLGDKTRRQGNLITLRQCHQVHQLSIKTSSAMDAVEMHRRVTPVPPSSGSVMKTGCSIECTSPFSAWRSNGEPISAPPTPNRTDDPTRLSCTYARVVATTSPRPSKATKAIERAEQGRNSIGGHSSLGISCTLARLPPREVSHCPLSMRAVLRRPSKMQDRTRSARPTTMRVSDL